MFQSYVNNVRQGVQICARIPYNCRDAKVLPAKQQISVALWQAADYALLPFNPTGRYCLERRADLVMDTPYNRSCPTFSNQLHRASLTGDVNYFYARLLFFKYDCSDALPEKRITVKDPGFPNSKCRANVYQSLRFCLEKIIREGIVRDAEIIGKINTFRNYRFDPSRFTTKTEIDLMNQILDVVIAHLLPFSNHELTQEHLRQFREKA